MQPRDLTIVPWRGPHVRHTHHCHHCHRCHRSLYPLVARASERAGTKGSLE